MGGEEGKRREDRTLLRSKKGTTTKNAQAAELLGLPRVHWLHLRLQKLHNVGLLLPLLHSLLNLHARILQQHFYQPRVPHVGIFSKVVEKDQAPSVGVAVTLYTIPTKGKCRESNACAVGAKGEERVRPRQSA
jgi:hypothetical protein